MFTSLNGGVMLPSLQNNSNWEKLNKLFNAMVEGNVIKNQFVISWSIEYLRHNFYIFIKAKLAEFV